MEVDNQPPVEEGEKSKKDKKRDKKNKERKHQKDQEEKVVIEAGKQSKQPSGLEDKSAEKKEKKKEQKRTHSTSEHSTADTSMPINEEKELPKNLGTSAEPDASKEPTDRISGDSKGLNQAK
ncbi:hypothetical protein A2U01_0058305, partial [Trifolium medium]|nr:hypothetical protein [Trifolium medium]